MTRPARAPLGLCLGPVGAEPLANEGEAACGSTLYATVQACRAPGPESCLGTDWPPMTSWQRYTAERLAGERVPPSVSTWREQDRRRQAAIERESREQAPRREAAAVPWCPSPSCDAEGQP